MSSQTADSINPKTGMRLAAMKTFIRNHFKNLVIADVNFAAGFLDNGADVPAARLETPHPAA